MKHLKLFREGVNDAKKSDYDLVFIFDLPDKEDFYKHINKEEWMGIRNYKHKLVDFPGSQMDILNRTHTTHESYCKWNLAREHSHYTCYRNDSYTNPTTGRRYTRSSWIFLLDDEWYVIQDVVLYGGVVVEEEWYKCDQFDGLIELLKDKKIVDDEKHLKDLETSFYKCDGLDGLIQQLKEFKFIYDLS